MERPIVIYHSTCPEGFSAAYAFYDHFRRGEECACDFAAAVHGEEPPDVTGTVVTGSLKRAAMSLRGLNAARSSSI